MLRHLYNLSIIGAVVVLCVTLGGTAFAAHVIGQPILPVDPGGPNRQPVTNTTTTENESGTASNSSSTNGSADNGSKTKGLAQGSSNTNTGGTGPMTTAEVKPQLHANQLKVCGSHADVIGTIMNRATTRAQNQITLFGNVATKVESFYISKGKTIATYAQLTAAVTTAESTSTTDLATLKANSTFSCSANNPTGVVSTYRTDLQQVHTDLQVLRTAVRNLILGVAQAEGVTLSKSATQGAQQ